MHQRLLARTRAVYIWLMAPLLGLAVFLGVLATVAAPVATAATSSNLNFQARLLTNTGAVVPDGNYNIEFKIYTADGVTGSQGSCSGSCVWMESRTVAGGTSVQVINGYFSVNLGSVNAFGAGINWDQQLWLTMRIGGTAASPSWDAEMQNSGHSIALTALPYAFVAAQLAKTDGSGNRGTLSFGSVTNNPVIQLPNESGTVCTTAASGVCNTAGGLTNVAYLNQTQTFTGTNTFQPSTNVSSLIVKQTTVASPTADIFDVQTVNATKVIQVTTSATDNASLRLSSVGTGSTVLLQGDDEKISFSGTESRILIDTTGSGISNFIDFFRNSNTTSSRRLRVFKGDGTSTETFGIDASSGNILMGNNLDLETAGSLTIGGSTATTVTLGSTTASSGSQTFNIGNNATAGTYASTVNVGSTLNASTTTIKGGSGGINLSPSGASNSGVLVKPGADSTFAFQVQNASSSKTVMAVDTTNNQLLLGAAGASGLNGKLVFNTTNASNTTITIQAASTASSYSLTLPTAGPALGQCLQNDGTTVGQLTFGPCGASGTFLNKNATDTSSANAGSGFLYTFTNSGSAGSGGVLSLDNGTNTGTILSAKGTSTTAFQVMDNNSHKVITVDTSNSVLRLGQASTVNGGLVFQNSSNSNGITLNSTSANANYTLTLPAQSPSGGLCIQTSTGNASQLVFASCANNNTSISEVAYWDANSATTKTISPLSVGDEIVLTTEIPSTGVSVSGVSGGGVTNWSKVVTSATNGTVSRVEMWVGTVSSLGSSLVTVSYTGGSPGANEITLTEFTAAGVNQSTSWGIESSAALLNGSPSTTVTYPSLTAVNGAELYFGYAQAQNPPVTCPSCTTFTPIQTSTVHNMIEYNPSLTANTNYQPTAQSGSGQSNTVAAILTAFVTSTAINNSTSLQKANFYVQAANANSVAGVLQAASSGSGHILDLRDSGSNNVFTVSSTGDVTIQPAASTTALRVLNSSNYSVMAVDTSGNSVVLGDATHLSGSITFKDSGDSNTISITAPTSVATNYTLALPSNAPTAGLCLATSPSNANQLVFSSCATQVSAATISYVNEWDNHGTGVTSISSASPTSVGDLMVFYSHTGSGGTINTISGGGVASGGWTKVTAYTGAGTPGNIEMWRGVVATAGASAVNVTYTGTAGTNEIAVEEFTMGSANGTWAIDTSGTATNTGSVTTVNYPSLTPLNSNELYTGYAYGGGTMSLSSPTSGFTYVPTGFSKYITYKTNVTGGTPYAPVAQQTASVYASVAAIIEAYVGTSVIVNTTATQQANFNVQASLSGTVAGVLQGAASGSADVLQVKDGSGNNVMTVNGSSGVTLGTSNVLAGQIVFNAGGSSNTITIQAPSTSGTPGSSYHLVLPTTTPAAGQCLATSPSDQYQLVFSSCANQVTSVAISFVNSWKGTSGATPATLSTSPVNVGDLMVLFVSFNKADSVNSNGVSGGGCGTAWSKVASTGSGSGTDLISIEMYRCQIVTTGSNPISVAWSGPAGTHELAAMEFTTGSNTGSWVVDSSNTQFNGSSSTTATWPNLTPQSTKDLYVGYGSGGTFSGAVSSGYTYVAGQLSNRAGLYNTSVSAASQPTATQTSSASLTVGALIAAYSSSSVISNSTVTQQGNFNIQAATNGSVAGVLQAFAAGTGDIFDLLDGSGTLVGSVGSSGNMLVRPSTVSSAAFQVQNTSNANVLSVDTSAKRVVIGAGSAGESLSNITLLVLDSETGTTSDPTAVDGAMYYNATNRAFRCAVDGIWQNCSGMLYANTSKSTAISNCSNNCAAFDTTASIPVNYCLAGRVIKLSAEGVFSSTGSPNLQFGVYYGGDPSVASNDVLLGTLSPAVAVTSASNNYFNMEFNVTCFSPTSMQTGGVLNLQVGAAASGLTPLPVNAATAATVTNGPSAKNLYIFPVWSAANASNTAQVTQFTVTTP